MALFLTLLGLGVLASAVAYVLAQHYRQFHGENHY
jgi:hypothetical protein